MVYDPELRDVRERARLLRRGARASTRETGGFTETFVTAASPGIVTHGDDPRTRTTRSTRPTRSTSSRIAEELKREYEYVVAQGHVLQLDCPIWRWSG